MRKFLPSLLAVFLLGPLMARAQVTVNPQALDQGAAVPAPATPATPSPPPPAKPKPKPKAKPKPAPARPPAAVPAPPAQAAPPRSVFPPPEGPATVRLGTAPELLDVPEAPPASPLLPPAAPAPPAHPNVVPPPAPVVASAAGEVLDVPGGTRITFGPASADLNPATDAALREIGAAAARDPAAVVNVIAYAAGPREDPSTPRRLSLDRALAARGVLMAAGVPSTRIYVRALGTSYGEGPPDRVDLVVVHSTAALAATPPEAAPAPAPQTPTVKTPPP